MKQRFTYAYETCYSSHEEKGNRAGAMIQKEGGGSCASCVTEPGNMPCQVPKCYPTVTFLMTQCAVPPTSSACSKLCAATCAAWTSHGSPFTGRTCKESRCKMQRLPGPRCVGASLRRPSMPSPKWPSAVVGSIGRPSAGGEKCGCGTRKASSCTWSGRPI